MWVQRVQCQQKFLHVCGFLVMWCTCFWLMLKLWHWTITEETENFGDFSFTIRKCIKMTQNHLLSADTFEPKFFVQLDKSFYGNVLKINDMKMWEVKSFHNFSWCFNRRKTQYGVASLSNDVLIHRYKIIWFVSLFGL